MGLRPVRQTHEGAGSSEGTETIPHDRITGLQGLQYVDGPETVQFVSGAARRQQLFPARTPLARDILVATVYGTTVCHTERVEGARRPMPVRGRGVLWPRRRPTSEEAL